MIRLKPLPPIALTNLQPAFYDVESVSAIEMVSKLYAYLQEMVNDYNTFITEVNNEIEQFEENVDYKVDEFTECVKKLMNEYIESIDIKIGLQDKTIADAVDYMKNNLAEIVETLFNEALENGYITASLNTDYNSSTEELTFSVNIESGEQNE